MAGRMSFGFSHIEEDESQPEETLPEPQAALPPEELVEAMQKLATATGALSRSSLSWWNDPTFREVMHTTDYAANIAFHWEKATVRKGLLSEGELRVLSEYKVMRELVWSLFHPTSYFIIEKRRSGYMPREKVSIPSLTPDEFGCTVAEICDHLGGIEELKKFIKDVKSADPLDNSLPATYLSYAQALHQLFLRFNEQLSQLEEHLIKQDSKNFISHILYLVRPWLNFFDLVHSTHCKAVPTDWRVVDNWKCSVRLLVFLNRSLMRCEVGWEKNEMLLIFCESLRSYLDILDKWLMESKNYDFKDDFLITRGASEGGSVVVRPYKSYLAGLDVPETRFIDCLVYHASRACSSVEFISILKQNDKNPADHRSISVRLHREFVARVCGNGVMTQPPPRFSPVLVPFLETSSPQLTERDGALVDLLEETLVGILSQCLPTEGFAKDSLLSRYRLLERLATVRLVFLFHSSHMIPFSSYLFQRVLRGGLNGREASLKLSESVDTCLPTDECSRFQVMVNSSALSMASSVLSKLDTISITYSPPPVLEIIINKDILEKYNELFKLHLKLKWSLSCLTTVRLKDLKGNTRMDCELCSLRLFLLHTVQSLSNYLGSIVGDQLDQQMAAVCAIARDINVITAVHDKAVDGWRRCCFLTGAPKCLAAMLEVFHLCEEFKVAWKQQAESLLIEERLDSLNKRYEAAAHNLALSLITLSRDPFLSKHSQFGHLRDEITNNIPCHYEALTPQEEGPSYFRDITSC